MQSWILYLRGTIRTLSVWKVEDGRQRLQEDVEKTLRTCVRTSRKRSQIDAPSWEDDVPEKVTAYESFLNSYFPCSETNTCILFL